MGLSRFFENVVDKPDIVDGVRDLKQHRNQFRKDPKSADMILFFQSVVFIEKYKNKDEETDINQVVNYREYFVVDWGEYQWLLTHVLYDVVNELVKSYYHQNYKYFSRQFKISRSKFLDVVKISKSES